MIEEQDRRILAHARAALGEDRPSEALRFVSIHGRTAKPGGPRDADWLDVEIAASAALRRTVRLTALHELKPDAILRNEAASAVVMRALLQRRDDKGAAAIRSVWKGRETQPGLWLALDADALIHDRRRDDAIALLDSHKLEGKADSPRLLRLAVLHADDRAKAFGYLDEAFRIDPGNPDVRSFRAQVFDRLGFPIHARAEYAAACAAQPDNPMQYHALADFSRRQGSHRLAVQTWATAAQQTGLLDFMWTQAWFWDRVALGGVVDWAKRQPTSGGLRGLAAYLSALPSDRFWDERTWQMVPGGSSVLHDRQETLWLRAIQLLRDGREADAAKLVRTSSFKTASWAPAFEAALAWAPHLRGAADAGLDPPAFTAPAEAHPLHRALQAATVSPRPKLPDDLAALLTGREFYAALCLAEGWAGAAVFLHDDAADLQSMPDWLPFGLAQAMRITRGPDAALAFTARVRATSPALQVMVGEMKLERGDRPAARASLEPLAAAATPAGARAATLLALDALGGDGGPAAAAGFVAGNPLLSASVEGRELAGRIELARGDTNTAERILKDIVDQSPVAQAHFARTAFARGDLDEAERLVRKLADAQPDEPRHAAGLRAIAAARAGKPKAP